MPKPYGSDVLFIQFTISLIILSNKLFIVFLFLSNNQTWSVNYHKYYKLDPRRFKKQVLKNKLDEENIVYQENTSRIDLASQLQLHLFNKNNQIQPITG